MSLIVVVEGDTDLPIAEALASDAGFEIAEQIDCTGKHRLDAKLPGYNGSAAGSPWFVLRDLDDDEDCAPAFLRARNIAPRRFMCFRVAVREIESWILADARGFASFFGVREADVPRDPDGLEDPTAEIVRLSRRSSKREIRRGVPPVPGTWVAVGPLYEAKLIEFGTTAWVLDRAARRSPSLRGARAALRLLSKDWKAHERGERQEK